tara:strand:- start:1313 stop:1774 length:462 start_codon:yes stop_codon:yes gene_type:complete
MNKILNYILIFFLFALLSCDYKPILSKKKNNQFSIYVSKISGEEKINSIIINNFKNFQNNKKEYHLNLSSNKEKNIVSKDSKGDPSVFELIIDVNYKVKKDGEILIDDKVIRKTTYNNISDKFELDSYENIIINNLSTNISDKIIFSISEINE